MALMPNINEMRASMTEFIEGTHFDEELPAKLPPDPEPTVKGEGDWDEGEAAPLPYRPLSSTTIQL
jgi:hypothetical protein